MRARPPRTGTTTKWQMHKEIQKKEKARGAGRGARSGRTKVMQGGSGLRSSRLAHPLDSTRLARHSTLSTHPALTLWPGHTRAT